MKRYLLFLALMLALATHAQRAPQAAFSLQDGTINACCPIGWYPHWVNSRQAVCKRKPQGGAAYAKALALKIKSTPRGWMSYEEPKPETSSITGIITSGSEPLFTTINSVFSNIDTHGCNYSFSWDEERGLCSIHVTFTDAGMGFIGCSPVSTDYDKTQHMICWYKPVAKSDAAPESEPK